MAKAAPKAKSRTIYADAVEQAPMIREKKENSQAVNSDKLSPGKGPQSPAKGPLPAKGKSKDGCSRGLTVACVMGECEKGQVVHG